MDVVYQHRYHILHLARSVSQSGDVGHKGIVVSIYDNRNTRFRPSDVVVRVEATNPIATVRLEGAAQEVDVQGKGNNDWGLRAVGKLNLPLSKARSRKIQVKRQHQLPQQHRKGRSRTTSSSSTSVKDAPSVATQYLGTGVPYILHPRADVDAEHHVGIDTNVCIATIDVTDTNAHAAFNNDVDTWGGSSPQPSETGVANTR
ncbi:hypothetical protein PVK06_025027 [Gossypium arboreum]|uniref:Uncharacterized protein n=1 Tax=Gossypium arboreum TaxID=29729 RepID=A0ABR0PFG6_GOSAR|nr:hypothetical protein PVK06_025027 [Gossypium arboreum]